MGKVKKTFLKFILLLLTVLMCMPFVACGNEQAQDGQEDNEVVEPLGLYTDLQFSLNGENGQVRASVKNKFTLFPSTVTVNIELYRFDTYQEDYKNMTLAASNYIYDLDQGKTITATASTDGKSSYWKARAYYRVDNKSWKENLSDTVYLNKDGIKTSVSAPVTEDKEYFISDFLQSDADTVSIHFYPYKTTRILSYDPDPTFKERVFYTVDDFVWLDSVEEINTFKDLFGEVKLDRIDKNELSDEEKTEFYSATAFTSPITLYTQLSDGSVAQIYVNDCQQDFLGKNVYVTYSYTENENMIFKRFAGLVTEEIKQALLDFINDLYKTKHNINAYVTEWINFTDLLQGGVQSGNTDLRLRFHYYGVPEKRINYAIDGSDLNSLKEVFSGVEVTPYDMNKEMPSISAESYFNTSIKYPYYSLSVKFDDGRTLDAYISYMYTSSISVNLFIIYNDGEERYFSGLMDIETQEALVELTKNIYDQKTLNEILKIFAIIEEKN